MILYTYEVEYICVGLAAFMRFRAQYLFACWTIYLLRLSVHSMLVDWRICVSALRVLIDDVAPLSLYGCICCYSYINSS